MRWLRAGGHTVTRVVRSYSGLPHGERAVVWHPSEGRIEAAGLEGHDVVIHLAGESLAGLWTDGKKRRIMDSRVQGTSLLARTLAALDSPPRLLITASGTNIYPPGSQPVDERTPGGEGFLPDVVRAWEGAADPARDAGIRVVHCRFGNVLSPDGGLLEILLPLARMGLLAQFGSGRQPWPWVARQEIGPAMLHVVEHPEISGPVNVVAPEIVTNAQFTDAVAAAVSRPRLLTVPGFLARLAPGNMADELLLAGAAVRPRVLQESGYDFRHPLLAPALGAMVSRG